MYDSLQYKERQHTVHKNKFNWVAGNQKTVNR